jgi:hypothetical protein
MPETVKPTANAAQIEHWNVVAGKTSAQHQELRFARSNRWGLWPLMR